MFEKRMSRSLLVIAGIFAACGSGMDSDRM